MLTGEDVNFAVNVTKGEPDTLTVELVMTPPPSATNSRAMSVWRLSLRGLSAEKGFEKGFTYRVFGGRTWTKQNRIDWAERPVILDTQVKFYYPDYMAIPNRGRIRRRNAMSLRPVGSRVEVAVTVEERWLATFNCEARVKRTPNPDRRWFTRRSLRGTRICRRCKALQPAGDHLGLARSRDATGQYRVELRTSRGTRTIRPAGIRSTKPSLICRRSCRSIGPATSCSATFGQVAVTISARDDTACLTSGSPRRRKASRNSRAGEREGIRSAEPA